MSSALRNRLARAELLLNQRRPAEALAEAQAALALDPSSPGAHGLSASSLLALGRASEALPFVQRGVGLQPDEADGWNLLSGVLRALDRKAEAFDAIGQAIRLNPRDADHFSLRATYRWLDGEFSAALADIDAGLAIDPQHVRLLNQRAGVLDCLNQLDASSMAVESALRLAPENPTAHTLRGWNLLERGDARAAHDAFRESLRLDPRQKSARKGLLEALKARSRFYRLILGWFFWLGRQDVETQSLFRIRGRTLAGVVFVAVLAFATPRDQAWFWIFALAAAGWGLFAYLSLTAVPMFNLFLRLDRLGRHVLTDDERLVSSHFAIGFIPLVASIIWWLAGGEVWAIFVGMISLGASILLPLHAHAEAIARREAESIKH